MDNRGIREQPTGWVAGAILGIVMMLVGVILVIYLLYDVAVSEFAADYVIENIFSLLSRVLLIIGGYYIFRQRMNGNYFAVGIYAIALGISRILRSMPGLGSSSDLIFYVNVIFVIVGANLILSGVNHLTVRTKDPTFMRYTTGAVVGGYILLELTALYLKFDHDIIDELMGDSLMYVPLYVALLAVLFTKELVIHRPIGRIISYISSTADTLSMGSDVSVSAEDGRKLIDGFSAPGWEEKTVGGRRVKEERITFCTKRGQRDVVMNRWDDDPALYISVVDDARDSFVTGHRIKATGYSEHDGTIDLLDDMGVCASIRIAEAVQ